MADKSLFQIYAESNPVGKRSKDLTGVGFDNFIVKEFVRRDGAYFIWRCVCSCGAVFDRSSKTINSHPDGHCGSSAVHSEHNDPEEIARLFLSYFTQDKESECWEWSGNRNANGYGRFRDKNVLAHRFSYEHFVGPIDKDKMICHHCDNPPCVNPHHLYAGTASDNMLDKHERARHWPFALAPEDVRNIRVRMAAGLKYGDIRDMSEEYGCGKSLLQLIKNNKIWKEVPWPSGYDPLNPPRLTKGGKVKYGRGR